jgi:hypothetical protein
MDAIRSERVRKRTAEVLLLLLLFIQLVKCLHTHPAHKDTYSAYQSAARHPSSQCARIIPSDGVLLYEDCPICSFQLAHDAIVEYPLDFTKKFFLWNAGPPRESRSLFFPSYHRAVPGRGPPCRYSPEGLWSVISPEGRVEGPPVL